MTKVISIANQKGGVGKTSTTVNLGAALKKVGKSVLLLDLDAQSNLTLALGYKNPDSMEFTVSNVLEKAIRGEEIDPKEGVLTNAEGIDLMPANIRLAGFDAILINEIGRETKLRQYLDKARKSYDYILIDCAPSLNIVTINALVASDSVIIPTQPQYFSAAGLQMIFHTIGRVRSMNPDLSVEGIVVTMMDNRPAFTRELVAQLHEAYDSSVKVFDTEIPTSIRVTECGAMGVSIFEHDPKGKVAKAYLDLAKEVIENGRN